MPAAASPAMAGNDFVKKTENQGNGLTCYGIYLMP
jgi:hypothetical protein